MLDSKDHAMYLCLTSLTPLLSAYYALYNQQYDFMVASGGVTLTSLLYWHNPVKGWRRTVDMSYVSLSLLYHVGKSFQHSYSAGSLALFYYIFIGGLCYRVGWLFHNKQYYKTSIFMHSLIHFIGTIGNIHIYSLHL